MSQRRPRRLSFGLALLLLAVFSGSGNGAQVRTEVIAITGDLAPDGNGNFVSFGAPVLNDSGQVAFRGSLSGTVTGNGDDSGIFRANSTSGIVQIARGGSILPGAGGEFSSFSLYPAINEAGQVAFSGTISVNGSEIKGVFRGDGIVDPTSIALAGDVAPGGVGTYSNFGVPVINEAGQLAYQASISDAFSDFGIFIGDGSSPSTKIARAGDIPPDGIGEFSSFNPPSLNNSGEVAFSSILKGTEVANDLGIYLSSSGNNLVQLARVGQDSPDGKGKFTYLGYPALNDNSQIAFSGILTNTYDNRLEDRGLFLSNANSSVKLLARSWLVAPDGNGSFSHFGSPALNDDGQLAFRGELTVTDGLFSDSRGIFFVNGFSGPSQIARGGETTPSGDFTFSTFNPPSLNNAGQIAFTSQLFNNNDGPYNNGGLFFYDDVLGLVPIFRGRDAMLGSTITGSSFSHGLTTSGDEGNGLNENGQVAFRFKLADGRQGIAIATVVPEPGTFLLSLLAVSTLLKGDDRRRQVPTRNWPRDLLK